MSNYEEIIKKKDLQRMTKINIWQNNETIPLNVLYAEKEKIYPIYVWKHNSDRKKRIIF